MSHKLTLKQLKALYMLLEGFSTIDIAAKLGMRRETLSRWKRLPQFQARFQKIMEERRLEMHQRLMRLGKTSLDAIQTEIASPYCNVKRVEMALNVLEMMGYSRETAPNLSDTTPKLIHNTAKEGA